MARIDDIAEDNNYFNDNSLIERIKQQTLDVKNFIKMNKIGQYFVVYVDFGEKLTQKYENNKLISRNPNEKVSIKEMLEFKGYNCGFNEFRYTHMAVILSSIHHKYLLSPRDKHYSLLVAPISSSKKANSYLELNLKYHKWLENPSFILLDKITHISLEKININLTKNLYKKNQNNSIFLTSRDVLNLKDKLKEIFDI